MQSNRGGILYMDYKFEVGEIVCIKPNFIELWNQNRPTLPLEQVIEHIESMIGKGFEVLDRSSWDVENLYNVDGFGLEEYILEKYE